MASLETFVHLNASALPLNRYLVRIEILDALWNAAVILNAATASVGQNVIPNGKVSLDFGDAWAASGVSALLLVSSVIAPEEHNILINSLHADAKAITASRIRKWHRDAKMGLATAHINIDKHSYMRHYLQHETKRMGRTSRH